MQGQLHFGDYMKCYFDLSEEIKKQADRARICTILRGLGINSGLHRPAESIPVPEFIDPPFRENKPKTLIFSHRERAYWACFRENSVYNFGHWSP
jgi:hypothetical protein